MCAQVLKFRPAKGGTGGASEFEATASAETESGCEEAADTSQLQFWVGASGARYIHTVHTLFECPEMPDANYLLIRRDACGTQQVLAIGQTANEAPSLNLAEIRRLGATLGANEVHIHMLAGSAKQAKVIEHDLRRGQLCSSLPPSSPSQH